ncbi:hypothetical protein [Leptolyngbya sp. BC1307]|jgi:hypothetical protein|uniref:hypothetical protein n=1 Tax=Leptolyngbya sp. BC1307 TaxID=2029589 RepID=UPI0011411046|nr:hypothetical protein [Leptolyngbya sp. BC1307]
MNVNPMASIKSVSTRTGLLKRSLLAVAALGLAFPGVSVAQTAAPQASATRTVLADGTYLFGQSPEPGEIGATYAVLSVENNQTVGAFYQPSSSFDCFSGQIMPDKLAVNVVDSYDQTVHPYSIALAVDDSPVVGAAAGAYGLEGFHRIESISDQDQEILGVCQADLAQ